MPKSKEKYPYYFSLLLTLYLKFSFHFSMMTILSDELLCINGNNSLQNKLYILNTILDMI